MPTKKSTKNTKETKVEEKKAPETAKEEQKEESKNNWMLPVAIVIAGVIIGGAVLYSNSKNREVYNNNNNGNTQAANPSQANNPSGQPQQVVPSQPQPTQGSQGTERYVVLAKEMGFDEGKFRECMDNFDSSEVEADREYGGTVGANGTPTFFIGTKKDENTIEAITLIGAQPTERFNTVIEAILNSSNMQSALNSLPAELKQDRAGGELKLVNVGMDDDPKFGNDNAKVIIVEFSDYECPFCKRYYETTYNDLKNKYINDGLVQYVYRDLPLPFHEPIATEEAVAANCAREQGGDEAYFRYHDEIFTRTGSNKAGI